MPTITTTPQDITGDFDVTVSGNPSTSPAASAPVILQKALGSGGTNWVTCKVFGGQGCHFVKNTGTNAYRIAAAVAGVSVDFNQ